MVGKLPAPSLRRGAARHAIYHAGTAGAALAAGAPRLNFLAEVGRREWFMVPLCRPSELPRKKQKKNEQMTEENPSVGRREFAGNSRECTKIARRSTFGNCPELAKSGGRP